MSYRERQRLADIQAAIEAIRSHMQRGCLSDGLVFDAVRIRLLEIGEAFKALPEDLLASQPSIAWRRSRGCATTWRTATSTLRTPFCKPPLMTTCPPWSRQSARSPTPCLANKTAIPTTNQPRQSHQPLAEQ